MINENAIDVILRHYRERPGKFAHLQFGRWFHDAHGNLIDPDLASSQTVAEAKRLIISRGYDCLGFNKLVEYNNSLERV